MDISILSFMSGVIMGGIICIIAVKIASGKNDAIPFLKKLNADLERDNAHLNQTVQSQGKNLAVSAEQLRAMNAQMADWEKTKQEFMTHSKLASVEVTEKLTKTILEQHEQQSKRTADETEKRIEKSTKDLHESYKDLFSSVGNLKENLDNNANTVETIKKAISSSATVGYASETVLESTLSAFGLTKDHDFFTQITVDGNDGGKLRPDAVVFLPGGNALVIDSKSSQFIYQLAEAEHSGTDEQISQAYKNLKSSMSTHLKGLVSKDYSQAIIAEMRKRGKTSTLNNITVIMWLPNDGAVEKVLKADPTFSISAGNQNVFVCGPSGLWTAVGMASQNIRLEDLSKNNVKIVEEAEKLLSNIATVVGHGKKVSSGLNSANTAWAKFTSSFDGRFIASAKRIEKLGVKTSKELITLGDNSPQDALTIEMNDKDSKE